MNNSVVFEGDCNLTIPIDGDLETMVKIAGLEYETGFCGVSSTSTSMTIPFYKSHTKAPFFCAVICNDAYTNSLAYHSIMSPYYLYGEPVPHDTNDVYAYIDSTAVRSSVGGVMRLSNYLQTSDALETILDNEKWVATTTSTSYKFDYRNDYKYIAIWAPED